MPDFARSDDPAVQAQLDRLAQLSPGGDRLGLDRITRLLDRLGRPQDRLPPAFHVAGTNGKGSTCAFLRAAIEASGRTVHIFTSPHLVRFNERIRIAGTLITDEQLAAFLSDVLDAAGDIDASFFEVTTAVAFLAFARTPADAAVIEVGLGGRLDATNMIDRPLVCGIAALGIDHQQFLGNSLVEIAGEKAGIAKPGVPLVVLSQPPEAEAAIQHVADLRGAPVQLEGRDWTIDPTLRSSLLGDHQVRNANLAWHMLRQQDHIPISRASFLSGLTSAQWPARFQELAPGPLTQGVETWLDGAHNPEAAKSLALLLVDHGPKHIILGVLANKDADAIVDTLRPHALSFTFVPVPDHAHHDPQELARRFGGHSANSLEDALNDLPAPRLIAGSLYLAGEALRLNEQVPD
ncbi:folylpolyglutamate synthase/dihydrofolate synthase family protein [Sphingomonas daechungensis]|uniref:Bifunctional folylpolyglutamate synthase/dihydrofolate synthase n=1 Tax=Sphingomonas daechungensis TaxID=1176646 RepID=A0ABX6T2Q6_9SPHN|nr:folylpolyglutamate synthase/dihydrofolate synthase family protein [Sphingomonas daechungensis]QNP42998.1 bifunctional folylpolyglutamate synthase/dihydrofolate synthase [Sphingomonas daechungensis]